MNAARWFALVVGLQAAFLLGWAGFNEWSRSTAPTILLETAPVDPRDFLRGDYLVLSYKISRVPAPASHDPRKAFSDYGREIWVTLRRDGRFHVVESTSWTLPASPEPDRFIVRGHTMGESGAGQLRVNYGIEKFFVPEGKGRPAFKEMVVEATVTAGGRLGIKRLLLDGKPFP